MKNLKFQEIEQEETFLPENALDDRSRSGRKRPWKEKKVMNEYLALVYDQVNPKKAIRLRECSKFLLFRRYSDGSKKLHGMTSCRVRLCPICSWRRSLKTYFTMRSILDQCRKEHDYAYLFLTLTVESCQGDALSDTLDRMMRAWNNLLRDPAVDKPVKAWYRAMEVTHNVNPLSESYDTFHPHFHVLIAVNPSYFKDGYLSQARWTQLWQRVLGVDYTPIVDIRRVKGDDAKAVAECAKYSVKDADYLIPEDWDLTVETVRLLDRALDRRRFVAYGKEFKRIKQVLGLEDEEDGSLVDVGDPEEHSDDYILEGYCWYSGYRQYYRVQ